MLFLDEIAFLCYNTLRTGGVTVNILKESDFRKELKNAPRAAYLFFGDEDYLKLSAVRLARETLCPDPSFAVFNEMRLDATDFTADRLVDTLMPMPMTTYSGSCVSNDTESSVRMPQSFLPFSTGSFGHLMEGCMPVTCRTALHTQSPASAVRCRSSCADSCGRIR